MSFKIPLVYITNGVFSERIDGRKLIYQRYNCIEGNTKDKTKIFHFLTHKLSFDKKVKVFEWFLYERLTENIWSTLNKEEKLISIALLFFSNVRQTSTIDWKSNVIPAFPFLRKNHSEVISIQTLETLLDQVLNGREVKKMNIVLSLSFFTELVAILPFPVRYIGVGYKDKGSKGDVDKKAWIEETRKSPLIVDDSNSDRFEVESFRILNFLKSSTIGNLGSFEPTEEKP
jgi:hypothetical protein